MKIVFRSILIILIPPVMLFVSAGTVHWLFAWIYIIISTLIAVFSRLVIHKKHPDFIKERSEGIKRKDVPLWDKRLLLLNLIFSFSILIVAGLDKRFGWTNIFPDYLIYASLILFITGNVFSAFATYENRYYSSVVRIQKDKGHEIITSGPYRYVRHPGYAGWILANISATLLLNSLWAMIPAVLMSLTLVKRILLEEKMLSDELKDYKIYKVKTRYRLIPGIW